MNNIIIILKAEENNQSDVFDGTWLDLSITTNEEQYYRVKDGDDYLLILTDLDNSGTEAEVVSREEYVDYGFEEVEGDTLYPTKEDNTGRKVG